MWWDRSERLEVYLGSALVGFGDGAGNARWHAAAGLDDALAQLARWTSERAAPRLRVWLASTLARPFMVGADSGARSGREAAELAVVLAREVLPAALEPRVWCAPWRAGRPTLAVAMPGGLHERLHAPAPQGGAPAWCLESLRPWWNPLMDEVVARARGERRGLGWSVGEPGGLVVGRVVDGQLLEVGFEAAKRHDPDWSLLRRRLAASWHDVEAIEHVDLDPAARATPPVVVGAARSMVAEAAA